MNEKTTHHTSFRAEFLGDVCHARAALSLMGVPFTRFEIRLDPVITDCVAEIETSEEIDLDLFKAKLEELNSDTHVIQQTVRPLKMADNSMERQDFIDLSAQDADT